MIFLAIKVALIGAIVLFFCQDSVIELLKTGYVEVQKEAYEGKDIQEYILLPLALVASFGFMLLVLLFMLSTHPNVGLFVTSVFGWLLITLTLSALNTFYKDEIANYLKTTYQVEQNVSESIK